MMVKTIRILSLKLKGWAGTVPAMKFLGIYSTYVDPALCFNFDIKQILNKIARSMYAIQSAKNMLTSNALKSLYFALVHSHLVYGIQIWSVAPQKSLNQLNIFQKKCIRIITERKTGILRLQDLITYFKLLFMYDYLNEHLPISFRHIWILNEQYRLTHNPLEGEQ